MPYWRLQHNWHITMKDTHPLRLDVREGLFRDSLKLYLGDEVIAQGMISILRRQGYALFELDGRTLELRWMWDAFAGDPVSILIMYKGRILAQHGNDKAARIQINDDQPD